MLAELTTVLAQPEEAVSSGGGDMTAIVVALIMALPAAMAAFLSWRNHRTAKKARVEVENIRTEVTTNDGKRAYEYLEMVATVAGALPAMRNEMSDLQSCVTDGFKKVNTRIDEHTAQDDRRFGELKTMISGEAQEIDRLDDDVQTVLDAITGPDGQS